MKIPCNLCHMKANSTGFNLKEGIFFSFVCGDPEDQVHYYQTNKHSKKMMAIKKE